MIINFEQLKIYGSIIPPIKSFYVCISNKCFKEIFYYILFYNFIAFRNPKKVIWVNLVKDLLQITFLLVSQAGLFKFYTACLYIIQYNIKYSYKFPIICTQLYVFKYSYIIFIMISFQVSVSIK